MGFAIKSLLFLLVIAVIGGFVINQIPSLRERVIEIINPAAKERRLLGELGINLNEVEKNLEEAAQQKDVDKRQEKINNSKNLLEKSRNLLNEIAQTNQDAGLIRSQIGKIIDVFTDQTPYPADHLEIKTTDQTNSPPPVFSCPPID